MLVKILGTTDVEVPITWRDGADNMAQERLAKALSGLGTPHCAGMFCYPQVTGTTVVDTHFTVEMEIRHGEPVAAEDVAMLKAKEFFSLHKMSVDNLMAIAFPDGSSSGRRR